nr:zinc finger protein 41 homolog isoform X1 [Desmodus rotundus]
MSPAPQGLALCRADRRVPWGGLTAEVMLAKPFLQVSCAGTSSAQTAGSPASPQQAVVLTCIPGKENLVMRADRPPEQDLPNETCIRRSLKTNKKVPTFLSSSKRNRSRTRRKESWVQPLRLRDRWGPRRGEGCPCRKGHSRDTPADVSSTAFRPREGRGSGELASTAGPSRGSQTSPGWAGSWLHVLAPPSRPRTSPAKCRFRTQTSGHLPTVTGG